MLLTVVVLAPWVVRNYAVFGRVVPLSTGDMVNLWYGTQWNEIERSGFEIEDPAKNLPWDELLRQQVHRDAFIAFVKADPPRFIRLALRKGVSFWSLYFPNWSTRHKTARVLFFGPLFVLSLIGLVRNRAHPGVQLLWLLFLSTTVLNMVTVVDYDGRYRLPLEAFLPVTAGLAFRASPARFGYPRQGEKAPTE